MRLERATRLELATPTLARSCSTTELRPHPVPSFMRFFRMGSATEKGDNTAPPAVCKRLCVIPAKAGIQCRMSMRHMSLMASRRGPLDPRFHGDDAYVLLAIFQNFNENEACFTGACRLPKVAHIGSIGRPVGP